MVGLDPIALTGRFFSVLAAPRRALLRSGGGISLEPRSGDIVEPGARAPGLRLAAWQPSPGGATPGAGMEHRGGWSARRCRPRWGSGKWMIRVVLGLMPQALRSRPASGAQKRLTSNVGRTPLGHRPLEPVHDRHLVSTGRVLRPCLGATGRLVVSRVEDRGKPIGRRRPRQSVLNTVAGTTSMR